MNINGGPNPGESLTPPPAPKVKDLGRIGQPEQKLQQQDTTEQVVDQAAQQAKAEAEKQTGAALGKTVAREGVQDTLSGLADGTEPSPEDFISPGAPTIATIASGGEPTVAAVTEAEGDTATKQGEGDEGGEATEEKTPAPVSPEPTNTTVTSVDDDPTGQPPASGQDSADKGENASSPGEPSDGSSIVPPGSPPPAPPAGGEPPTNGQPDGTEPPPQPDSPVESAETIEPGAPGTPPPEAGDGESGSENGEIEPAPDQGNKESTQPNPDSPRDEKVKAGLEAKIDDLAEKVQKMLDDPNGDPKFKEAYKQVHDQLVDQELQNTANDMSKDLQSRIDKARENEQMTLAHVLEERQGRIAEMNEQAHRQAALELLNNQQFGDQLRQELTGVNGATPEMMRDAVLEAKAEADARRVLSSEELRVEGVDKKWTYQDRLAEGVDRAKKDKKPGTEMLEREYLDINQRRLRSEAMQKIIDETAFPDEKIREAAEARVKKLLELSSDKNSPVSKNPLLNAREVVGRDDNPNAFDRRVALLRQLAKREYVLSGEEGRLLFEQRKPGRRIVGLTVGQETLKDLADRIDQASGLNEYSDDKNIVKFADAQDLFTRQYIKELADQRQIAAFQADKRFQEMERDATLSTIAKEDIPHIRKKLSEIIEEQKKVPGVDEQEKADAKKQIKQKFNSYNRRWKHSFDEWRKNNNPETRKELWLSTKAIGKEALLTGLKWWGIWQLVMYLTIIAVEVRMAGKMFGQDGKG